MTSEELGRIFIIFVCITPMTIFINGIAICLIKNLWRL